MKRLVFGLTSCLAVLGLACSLQAAPVTFGYTQSDAATGAGSIAGFNADGILFAGPMPAAAVVQNDTTGVPLPPGIVGFINGGSEANPGAKVGVHLGWSGMTTLIGEVRDDLDPNTATSDPGRVNRYTMDVAMKAVTGQPHWYAFDTFDDNSGVGGSNDVTNTLTHRGWIGKNEDGHRHSGPNYSYGAGSDTFRAAESFGLGDNASGDDLGITAGVGPAAPDGTLFVDQIAFGGMLEPVGTPVFVGSVLAASRSGTLTGLTLTGSGLSSAGASIEAGAFAEDALTFTDRPHEWNSNPGDLTIDQLGLTGVDYVRFANDDKTASDFEAVIEMKGGPKNLFLLIDERVSSDSLFDIFNGNPFVDTGTNLGVDEDGTGDIDNVSSMYVLPSFEGTSITLGPQDDGGTRNMYGFVVQPLSIPEPSTSILLILGAIQLLLWRRR